VPPTGRLAGLGGRPFALLCASSLLFYLSFQLLLPVVPLYAARLGAREGHVGLIIGVFAFAAMLLRPVAGELADRAGRRPLVLAGAAIFAAASAAYAAVPTLGALLVLRLFHGVGMGLGPTAATVVAADLAPPERRGAAMGLYGITSTAGMAVGPYLGVAMVQAWGFTPTFLAAAAVALLALAVGWRLPETRPPGLPPPGGLRFSPGRLFSPQAAYPSLVLLALFFGYGGVVSFLPLFAERRGLGNPGLFFTAFAVAVVLVRPRAGQLADRHGRRRVAAPALVLAGAALAGLGLAASPAGLIAAALAFGVGFGAAQPALLAMTADRVPPEERGRAMGTLYTAWELGISGGSVLLGVCAARVGYPAMWWGAAGVTWLGAVAAAHRITRLRG
jgi:MFS family permease